LFRTLPGLDLLRSASPDGVRARAPEACTRGGGSVQGIATLCEPSIQKHGVSVADGCRRCRRWIVLIVVSSLPHIASSRPGACRLSEGLRILAPSSLR
jgi:hypothetical protein